MTIKNNLSFEEAHQELEKILTTMNSGKVSLEESLALFEQGEKLMRYCEAQLNSAELRIAQILKDRNGETLFSSDQTPKTAPFSPENIPF
ncbi:MAG TPA: exodeoxyribonuclease VII small subunit [Chlamydiales bacterium]|nr:exodeoxyribonuclease VII small subunit [Chlamydiales bacterium]